VVKPTVCIQAGIVIVYGSSVDAEPHRHHAIQIVWPKDDSLCRLNRKNISELAIIASGVEHQLQMSEGWILLVEPKSALGQELSNILEERAIKILTTDLATTKSPVQGDDLTTYLLPLFKKLKLTQHTLLTNRSTIADKRIQLLLSELEQCFHGDCIKPSKWRATEVAQKLALSESRFLHLFSQELGIAWRPYLLWRRMMCATQAIINRRSATEAAHLAGFSDSAHLSRTFRRTFGMTIRQALALFKES